MENQHRVIKGYRELSEHEISLMNKVKALGEQMGSLVKELESNFDADARWIEIGKTDIQKGLMALVRSIAQPTTF